jgi:ribonuclease BN (tRNA processing enzyme)
MKIYTLGTSHGAAEKGRACSASLIETGGNLYLIDCGGSVEAKMTDLGFNFASLRAVFVTHMHEDHVGALSAVVKRVWGYTKGEGKADVCLPEQAGIDAFLVWMNAIHASNLDRISFHTVTPGEFYRDDNITVSAIPTRHFGGTIPSYAYKIVCEGKTVLFSGDVRSDYSDFPKEAWEEDFDCIISELTHFTFAEVCESMKKFRTKKLIFNHVSARNTNVAAPVLSEFPFETIIAFDGACFEV